MRTVNDGFTEFLSRLRPNSTEISAGVSHRASVKSALEARLDVRAIYETGSFQHGTGIRSFSDIDTMVSLKSAKPGSSYTALTNVKAALDARFPLTTVTIRRPAVVIRFAGGLETWEVIPGYLGPSGNKDQLVYDIPAAETGGDWIESAPQEHLKYVNECNLIPRQGCAKDLSRLIKAWKYYCNVPISSFYLEMRAAQHVATQKTYIHVWDICQLLEKLVDHQLASMIDPTGAAGRIYPTSSTANRTDALSKLSTAATRARKALDASNSGKDAEAFYYLDLLFGGRFPAR